MPTDVSLPCHPTVAVPVADVAAAEPETPQAAVVDVAEPVDVPSETVDVPVVQAPVVTMPTDVSLPSHPVQPTEPVDVVPCPMAPAASAPAAFAASPLIQQEQPVEEQQSEPGDQSEEQSSGTETASLDSDDADSNAKRCRQVAAHLTSKSKRRKTDAFVKATEFQAFQKKTSEMLQMILTQISSPTAPMPVATPTSPTQAQTPVVTRSAAPTCGGVVPPKDQWPDQVKNAYDEDIAQVESGGGRVLDFPQPLLTAISTWIEENIGNNLTVVAWILYKIPAPGSPSRYMYHRIAILDPRAPPSHRILAFGHTLDSYVASGDYKQFHINRGNYLRFHYKVDSSEGIGDSVWKDKLARRTESFTDGKERLITSFLEGVREEYFA